MELPKAIEEEIVSWGTNTYPVNQIIAKLRVWCYVMNNWSDKKIQEAANFTGAKITSYYDEEGYCRLVEEICDMGSGHYDNGSSSGMHELYAFTGWTVDKIKELKFKALSEAKKSRLKSLKNEEKRIKDELKELES